jgi:3-oxoadipate:acetyl-CoA acetyltransferase
MSNRFIINVCLTGNVPTPEMNLHLPVSPEQIAEDVKRCLKLGASIFHVHARDERAQPDWRKETYQSIIEAIRSVSDNAIICVSTSGRKTGDMEKRLACLDTIPRPDMASVTLGSVDFLNDSMMNDPKSVRHILQTLKGKGIKPEIEIFDAGMARVLAHLVSDGVLELPCFVNLVLGNIASADAGLLDIAAILQYLPEGSVRCFGGIGKAQLKANLLGLLFADGVRVGLEDNIYFDDSKALAKNSDLVERILTVGALMGKSPLTIDETRARLRLKAS